MENLLNSESMEELEELEIDEIHEDDPDLDLSEFTPSVCNQKGKAGGKAGVLSVVNSNNGMRVVLSKELMEHLNYPKTVQVGLADHRIAISEYLGDDYTSYPMSKSGTKSIIYRSELVKQMTERYQLDFRDRTSITFSEVTYKELHGEPIALIKVKEK